MLEGLASSVAQGPTIKFAIVLCFSAAVATAASWGAYAMLIRKRVLQDTPTSLIRSAPQGYIELQGYAELIDGEPIHAPLSTDPCIWYQYKVEERRRHGARGTGNSKWYTVASGKSDSLFYLVDTSGRCAVDPEGAKVTPSSKDVWYGKDRFPGRANRDQNWFGFIGFSGVGRSYRYTERRIEIGDPIYALGDFTTHGGSGAAFDRSSEIRELLSVWKNNSQRLLERFDANQDGEIDMQEWQTARDSAAQEIDLKRAETIAAPPIDVLAHARGSRNPFIIAARSEEHMLARFHWAAVGLFGVALVASVIVVWLISVR